MGVFTKKKRRKRQRSKKKSGCLSLPITLLVLAVLIGSIGSEDDASQTDSSIGSTSPTISQEQSAPSETTTISVTPTMAATTIIESVVTIEPSPDPTLSPTPDALSPSETVLDPKAQVFKQGDSNEDVRQLQLRLIALGYLSGNADGEFGSKTEKAVRAYQEQAGLSITGECDYNTYLSITDPYAPKAPTPVPTEEPTPEPEEQKTTYVYNKNTKKFHYSWCSSADDIKAKNRGEFTGTSEEMVKKGYQPCKRCNP